MSSNNCLITGGAGFIGSHLAERLLALGHRVMVVDDLSTGQKRNLDAVLDHPALEYVEGTIEDDEHFGEIDLDLAISFAPFSLARLIT